MEHQRSQSQTRDRRRSFHGEPPLRSSERQSRTEESFRHSIHDPELHGARRTASRQSQHCPRRTSPRRTSSATFGTRHISKYGSPTHHPNCPENVPLRDLRGLQTNARHHRTTIYQHKAKADFTLKGNPYLQTYSGRIISSEMVNLRIPSSCGLPTGWTSANDRFITYLATHAPLVRSQVPRNEASCERYSVERIAKMCTERFSEFRYLRISAASIENRLAILDLSDNDYFSAPYGAYQSELWGQDI